MRVIHTIDELIGFLSVHKSSGKRIALVPTMGNLHQGHLHLAIEASSNADIVVVSLFVNPMQFSAGGDFDHYPRTLKEDENKLKKINVDVLFAPSEAEIYPRPLESTSQVTVPNITDILCGAHRSGHFTGVTTVVAKLFNIVQPQVAFFGEKDFQQLQVIRTMVADLNMPIEIRGVTTVRDDDGLAMSSRNQYLTQTERSIAPKLYQILRAARQAVTRGDIEYAKVEQHAWDSLIEAGFKPDYVHILISDTLRPPTDNARGLRIFAAAWLGKARLIDNVLID